MAEAEAETEAFAGPIVQLGSGLSEPPKDLDVVLLTLRTPGADEQDALKQWITRTHRADRARAVSDPVRVAAAQLIENLRANRDSLPNGI